jgi:hypothetical protein
MENRTSPQPPSTEFALPSQRLAEYLSFFALAVPAAGAILFSGYVLLFLLALYSARPEPPYFLLVAEAGALALFLLVLPTGRMLRRNELSRAMLRNGLGAGIFFFLLNVAWPGFTLISFVGVWLPFVLFYAFLRNRRRSYP